MSRVNPDPQPPPLCHDAAMTGTAALRWGVAAATAALLAGGFALGLNVSNLHNGLIAASFSAVGLFVVRRRPGHREGWLFVATGAAHAVMFFGRQYGLHDGPLPGATWIGWLGVWPLPMVLVLIGGDADVLSDRPAAVRRLAPGGRGPRPARCRPLGHVGAVAGGVRAHGAGGAASAARSGRGHRRGRLRRRPTGLLPAVPAGSGGVRGVAASGRPEATRRANCAGSSSPWPPAPR